MKRLFLALLLLATPALSDTINLAWDKPTEDTEGNPLQELTGYKIYISNASGVYTSAPLATITPPTENYSFTQALTGTYYFVATAYNSTGESEHSNEVSTVVTSKLPSKVQNLRMQ